MVTPGTPPAPKRSRASDVRLPGRQAGRRSRRRQSLLSAEDRRLNLSGQIRNHCRRLSRSLLIGCKRPLVQPSACPALRTASARSRETVRPDTATRVAAAPGRVRPGRRRHHDGFRCEQPSPQTLFGTTRSCEHRMQQDVATGRQILRRGIFRNVVADAVLAGNEDHRGRCQGSDVRCIVQRAARQ